LICVFFFLFMLKNAQTGRETLLFSFFFFFFGNQTAGNGACDFLLLFAPLTNFNFLIRHFTPPKKKILLVFRNFKLNKTNK